MEQYFWLIGLIIFFGAFNQGFSGFGFALSIIPLLTLLIDIQEAVVLGALCGFIINIYHFTKLKKHIEFNEIKKLILGAAFGIPTGVIILKSFNTDFLKPILGIVIILFVLVNTINNLQVTKINSKWGYFTGLLSGLLGGMFNTNGPPVLIYFLLLGWDKHRLKATMTGYFVFTTILTILAHAFSGLTTQPLLIRFVYLIPFTITGLLIGDYLFKFVSSELYKKLLQIFLVIVSIFLIFG